MRRERTVPLFERKAGKCVQESYDSVPPIASDGGAVMDLSELTYIDYEDIEAPGI